MFDIIHKIFKDNWVFGTYYKYKDVWRVSFSKNIHGNIDFVLYDDIFEEMEKKSFKYKKALDNYCKAQIKKYIPF